MSVGLAGRLELLLAARFGSAEPGAVVAVYRDATLVEWAARGLAHLDPQTPLTSSTVLDVASVSKQMTAATLLCLAAEGRLDLDHPLTVYLPGTGLDDVTLRHCLQHSSGLPDYLAFADLVGAPEEQACSLETFFGNLDRFVAARQFAPGARISYSNTGYVLAALVAEQVTGQSWDEVVRERVLSPLGMTGSRAGVTVRLPAGLEATGYSPDGAGGFARDQLGEAGLAPGTRIAMGDGEVKTTAEDLAPWQGFLVDGQVLGSAIREQLLRRGVLADGTVTAYGMGIWWRELGGIRAFGHSGSMCGYKAYSLTDAESGTGVAVLSNRSDTATGDLAWRVLAEAVRPSAATGTWVSLDPMSALVASPTPAGGLDVDVDGVASHLGPIHTDRWVGPGTLCELRVTSTELVTSDQLGAVVAYRRCAPAAEVDLAAMAGEYVCDATDGELTIAIGDDGWWLTVGKAEPQRLVALGEVAGCRVFTAGGRLLVLDPAGSLELGNDAVRLPWRRRGAGDA